MPITLDSPITAPTVVAKEISRFTCDLQAMTVQIRFSEVATDGSLAGASDYTLTLLDANGQPRFTADEYASIKAALYRLALEDGVVSGTVA